MLKLITYKVKRPAYTFDEIITTPADTTYQAMPRGLHNNIWCVSTRRRSPINRVVCRDGNTISAQASEWTYCTPRNSDGPWTHVETGFPSAIPPDSWIEYAEEKDNLCGTVYGWIPVHLVREYINVHGGEFHTIANNIGMLSDDNERKKRKPLTSISSSDQ